MYVVFGSFGLSTTEPYTIMHCHCCCHWCHWHCHLCPHRQSKRLHIAYTYVSPLYLLTFCNLFSEIYEQFLKIHLLFTSLSHLNFKCFNIWAAKTKLCSLLIMCQNAKLARIHMDLFFKMNFLYFVFEISGTF